MLRHAALCLLSTCSVAFPLAAQAQARTGDRPPTAVRSDPYLELETYPLWDGQSEGRAAKGDEPSITVFRPFSGFHTRTAVVVAPGGGYVTLSGAYEGRQVADWFASHGVTAFVLKYRIGKGVFLPMPFSDGRRAIQFVRAHSTQFDIDPNAIGMIGFSAGGHLAATTAGAPVPGDPKAADPLDRVSSRPDFLMLAYPWLEGAKLDGQGGSQYCMFVRKFRHEPCDPKRFDRYGPTDLVTAASPPTFIYHTTNDQLVPAEGSARYYLALRAHGVGAELHIFEPGVHGTGLGGTDPSLSLWPNLLEAWLRARGLLTLAQKPSAQ